MKPSDKLHITLIYVPKRNKKKDLNVYVTTTWKGSLQEQTPGNTSSSSVTPYTVAPYHPIPDMFIPHKYRDIIPPDPIWFVYCPWIP
ncbi:hypothetical protein GLOIN_2v1780483 [Rhizophagus irregularis DAOM 181602=DAOM 197198]|uniref:Uncharacterized protein n=1 Tax=Rhizophagus irregularis (strain DAOM 181602 / DAOM 197198 / MUCL 43194) TaxID=747089 RepID=A0A2P4PME4_RHIID|nr:hypothetical protein GLOIN_2v1780483 [Rhizophagus irregularis DAOM 181602=DAOM 197198]POG66551.1 hypothetical protein GLOIN_2v1780483 [Rhizophagus irregularis DAOM 181602=DAOM 197198]GBC15816.2 hypothetical protein GLOIN_2v1780483 [Rhizophagus irregularis DAOM 181602=DAOM 197198]|eukprot:XP_025173417.1 hypothetical protein GLOIN_2v1780483 [Rhizophagus irregularis DAOM 181602=DAOM 197198]